MPSVVPRLIRSIPHKLFSRTPKSISQGTTVHDGHTKQQTYAGRPTSAMKKPSKPKRMNTITAIAHVNKRSHRIQIIHSAVTTSHEPINNARIANTKHSLKNNRTRTPAVQITRQKAYIMQSLLCPHSSSRQSKSISKFHESYTPSQNGPTGDSQGISDWSDSTHTKPNHCRQIHFDAGCCRNQSLHHSWSSSRSPQVSPIQPDGHDSISTPARV